MEPRWPTETADSCCWGPSSGAAAGVGRRGQSTPRARRGRAEGAVGSGLVKRGAGRPCSPPQRPPQCTETSRVLCTEVSPDPPGLSQVDRDTPGSEGPLEGQVAPAAVLQLPPGAYARVLPTSTGSAPQPVPHSPWQSKSPSLDGCPLQVRVPDQGAPPLKRPNGRGWGRGRERGGGCIQTPIAMADGRAHRPHPLVAATPPPSPPPHHRRAPNPWPGPRLLVPQTLLSRATPHARISDPRTPRPSSS